MGKEQVSAFSKKIYSIEKRLPDLNADNIVDLIAKRKQISDEEWNSFDVPYSQKKSYYEIIQSAFNSVLGTRDKKLTHSLLSILPEEDFREEIGERRLNSFIDHYLAREEIDEEQANILLSSPSLVASQNQYPNINIAVNAVKRKDKVNIPLILQRYPNLSQSFVFAYRNEKQYDELISFLDKYKIKMDDAEIQNETNYIFQMVVIDSMSQFQEKGYLSNEQRQTLVSGVNYLRWLLNHGGKIREEDRKYYQEIARNLEILKAMPVPTLNDSGYREFYGVVNAMSQNHLLAHRADTRGEREISGIKYELHGSRPPIMLSQLRTSFQRFLSSTLAQEAKRQLLNTPFAALGKEKLSTLLEQVEQDVESIVSYADDKEISQHLKNNQLLLISTVLFFKRNDTHNMVVGFYNDFCFIADRSRPKESGIEIYRLQGKRQEKQQAKLEVAKILADSDQAKVASSLTFGRTFTKSMVEKLKMQKVALIPLAEQYGENCTWSSSAKMSLWISIYVRLFEAAIQLKEVQLLSDDKKMEVAHQMAQQQAKALFSLWSHDDKYQFIKQYCDFFEQPHMKPYGPDPILLCEVYLRAKQRARDQDIVRLLEDRAKEYLTPANMEKAKQSLYEMAQSMLKEAIPSYLVPNNDFYKEVGMKFATLFLFSSKKIVSKVYDEVEKAIREQRIEDVSKILDSAIAKFDSTLPKGVQETNENMQRGKPIHVSFKKERADREKSNPDDYVRIMDHYIDNLLDLILKRDLSKAKHLMQEFAKKYDTEDEEDYSFDLALRVLAKITGESSSPSQVPKKIFTKAEQDRLIADLLNLQLIGVANVVDYSSDMREHGFSQYPKIQSTDAYKLYESMQHLQDSTDSLKAYFKTIENEKIRIEFASRMLGDLLSDEGLNLAQKLAIKNNPDKKMVFAEVLINLGAQTNENQEELNNLDKTGRLSSLADKNERENKFRYRIG